MAGKQGGWVVLVLLSALSAVSACSSSSHTSTSSAASTISSTAVARFLLHGTYAQPATHLEDLKTLSPTKTSFLIHSGTIWHGDLEGDTTLVMHGVVDTKTGASSGTDTETFTGTVAGLGAGHLHFKETWAISPTGALSLDARVVSGDGALSGVHGTMHFSGDGDPKTGEGTGTYTATFTR